MSDFSRAVWQKIVTAGEPPDSVDEWAMKIWSDSHAVNGLSQSEARQLVRRIRSWALDAAAGVADVHAEALERLCWTEGEDSVRDVARDIRSLKDAS